MASIRVDTQWRPQAQSHTCHPISTPHYALLALLPPRPSPLLARRRLERRGGADVRDEGRSAWRSAPVPSTSTSPQHSPHSFANHSPTRLHPFDDRGISQAQGQGQRGDRHSGSICRVNRNLFISPHTTQESSKQADFNRLERTTSINEGWQAKPAYCCNAHEALLWFRIDLEHSQLDPTRLRPYPSSDVGDARRRLTAHNPCRFCFSSELVL